MMKHLLLLIMIIASVNGFSQYCGVSGPNVCTAAGNLTSPGWESSDSIPPYINNQNTSAVIEFMATDTAFFNSQFLIMDSMSIDTIMLLPEGLCYSMGSTNKFYQNRESGCIKISGVTCATPGQYKPTVQITMYLSSTVTNGIYPILLRIINEGDSVRPCDTTGAYNGTTPQLIRYGNPSACITAGVKDITSANVQVKLEPNPFSDITEVQVNGIEGNYDFEVFDLAGRLQQHLTGLSSNRFRLNRNQMANGLYLYRVISGSAVIATGKMVVN